MMRWLDDGWLKGLVLLMLFFMIFRELREEIRIEDVVENCSSYTDHYYGDDNSELTGRIRC